MVVPPYRLLPHPLSRYLNPRPPKMCRANATLPAGSLPVLQPSVLAGHQEQCVPLPVAALCALPVHCPACQPLFLSLLCPKAAAGWHRWYQDPVAARYSWGKCCPPGGKFPSGCCHLCFLLHWLQFLLTINVLAKVWLDTCGLCGVMSRRHQGTCAPLCYQGL